MAKSITHQRLVYKVNSSKFRKNNFDLDIDIVVAKKNMELVSLGDSTCLRMIREITGSSASNEEITSIKMKIKSLKKKKFSKENKEAINKLYKKLEAKTLISDYLLVVFNSIKDWDYANKNGIKFNGKTFVRLVGTNGGIKNNTVVFVNKRIHKKLDTMLNNGRNLDKHYVPAKFESYKALACSCSTTVSKPCGVLVVKDLEIEIKEDILKLHDDGDGGFRLTELNNEPLNKSPIDGCGMISPRLSEQWTIDMGEYFITDDEKQANYISSGFNVRNAFCKGMVFTFDFHEFGKVHGKTLVEDAWGNIIDINTVDLVLTTNMLKLWDAYDSIDHYLRCCDENSFGFSVAKILPEKLEHVRNMNYQFLQSYEFSDEDIEKLVSKSVNNIKAALGDGKDRVTKMLLFLKGSNISISDFDKEEINWLKALMLDGRFIGDPFIKRHVYRMIQKKISDSKKGVIQVDGNYSIVSSDLYALCQHMFKLNVTGILGKHEFYAKTWIDKGIYEVVAFRAPMTIHNNIVKMKLIDNKDVSYWYRYMTTCTVLNIHDTTMEIMNGMDMDGDAVITTNNSVLLKNTRETKTVVCEQKSIPKQPITEKRLKDANKNGFGNSVGIVTNRATAMFDVISNFEKGSKEYNDMLFRITCMQGYQQEVIDSCKGIVAKQVPREWYDFKSIKINDTDPDDVKELKEYNSKLLADKKPYFFIYNYPKLHQEYKNYIKNHNNSCIIRFGLGIDELLQKEVLTDDEKEFIFYYKKYMPVSDFNSTMNRICHKIEFLLADVKTNIKINNLDMSFLITNKRASDEIRDGLLAVYKDYKKGFKTQDRADSADISSQRILWLKDIEQKVFSVCNDIEVVTNELIRLSEKHESIRGLLWHVCGEYIVDRLLELNSGYITFPIRCDEGDIIWNGEKYRLTKERV